MKPSLIIAAAFVLGVAACATALASQATHSDANVITAYYPEGPLWQGDKLYYAEMGADRVSVYENGQTHAFFTQEGCGPTAIAPYNQGFLVLCTIGGKVVAVDANGQSVREWGQDADGHPLRDPNDGYTDAAGNVYFSDPGLFSRNTTPHGYVMRLAPDGTLTRASEVLWYPNGVYIAPNGVVYVDEHMAGRVLQYDEGPDGRLINRRVFVDINDVRRPQRYATPYAETGPDGLEMGPDGDLWVAIYGEGRILRFSPDAHLVSIMELPTRYSTNIAFNAHGDAATTGSFDNMTAPYPGEVRFHPASTLTRSGH